MSRGVRPSRHGVVSQSEMPARVQHGDPAQARAALRLGRAVYCVTDRNQTKPPRISPLLQRSTWYSVAFESGMSF
jgi:hypothetical protein